jgi:hypothetical protein
MRRPVFALRVQAEPGIDAVRSLRRWLKRGLRDFGLRCVSIEQMKQEETVMDMRQYSSGFIKPDNVRDGPLLAHIVNVFISEKFNRPVLELDTGEQFTVNTTNNRVLVKAYGPKSEDWIGHQIKLALGHYKDWTKDPPVDAETVTLEAVTPRQGAAGNGAHRIDPAQLPAPIKKHTLEEDLDDEIPFA